MDDKKDLPELVNLFLIGKTVNDILVREKIYQAVLELLMGNISHLYQVLYRIDVKEEKVRNAFSDNPLAEVAAERITTLIIDRQLEKIKWRQKYSQ
ncbi:MAG TPA: hypothetical protein VNW06_04035 [Cytophagaceae bacterium]|jgi:hypothetical protein|nr:hypothetical protein [Cytophagaceae bacterium]